MKEGTIWTFPIDFAWSLLMKEGKDDKKANGKGFGYNEIQAIGHSSQCTTRSFGSNKLGSFSLISS